MITDLNSVASAVSKLAVNMGKNTEKFAKLGVTAKAPAAALGQLADILKGIEDPQKRAAVAAEALGNGWRELMPLLSEGSQGILNLTNEGIRLSGVTEESSKRAAEFGNNLERLKTGVYGLANSIINPLLPALNNLISRFTEAANAKNLLGWALTSGKEEENATQRYEELSQKLEKLRKLRDELSKPTFTNKLNNIVFGDVADLNIQISLLEKKQQHLKSIIDLQQKANRPDAAITEKTDTNAVDSFLPNSKSKGNTATAKAISDGQRLIDQLQSRLTVAQKLTEVERVSTELASDRYAKATPAEREIALSLAEQIDLRNTINKQLDEELASAREITRQYEEQEARLNQLASATAIGRDAQRAQDEALAESALQTGKITTEVYGQIIAKLREVKNEGGETFSELQSAIEGWGQRAADAFVDFCFTGKASFRDFATSILGVVVNSYLTKWQCSEFE